MTTPDVPEYLLATRHPSRAAFVSRHMAAVTGRVFPIERNEERTYFVLRQQAAGKTAARDRRLALALLEQIAVQEAEAKEGT